MTDNLLDEVLSQMTGQTPPATQTAAPGAPATQTPAPEAPVAKKKLFGYGSAWDTEYGKKG